MHGRTLSHKGVLWDAYRTRKLEHVEQNFIGVIMKSLRCVTSNVMLQIIIHLRVQPCLKKTCSIFLSSEKHT